MARGQWTKLKLPAFNPDSNPSFPPGELLALDPVTNQVIATIPEYGDGQSESFNESTWVWSNSTWSELLSLSPFADCVLMASTSTGVMCLSEPQDANAAPDFQAWTFNGSSWAFAGGVVQGAPVDSEAGSAVAYDPLTQQDLVYNGSVTWIWNGTVWSKAKTTVQPDASGAIGLGFDPLSGRIALIGADSNSNPMQAWWTGTNWKYSSGAATAPLHASDTLMGFVPDPVTGLMLAMVLPATGTDTLTSIWNGIKWVSGAPAKQTITAIAADPADKQILAIDQNNDMWVWQLASSS